METKEKYIFFLYIKKVINFFLKNLLQKVSAFFIALIVWFLVGSQNPLDTTEYQLAIPISYTNIPNQLVVTNQLIENINIKVVAQKKDKNVIKPSNFQAIIDLQKIKEGENVISITASSLQSNTNYKLISFTPAQLSVETDRVAEKSVSVRVITAGLEESNRVIKDLKRTPASVLIKGPLSLIQDLEFIETQPIDIDKNQDSQDFITNLNIPKNVSLSEGIENISGTILLGDKPANIRFDNIPIFPVGSLFEVRSNPKAVNFLLSGPENLISNLKKEDLKGYINLSEYQPGKYNIKQFYLNTSSEILIKQAWPPVDIWILNSKKNQP